MGLQVRLRHALGERLFDLPDRPAESPIIIGRAREAAVKIPSVTVASQHCALFVHDGQWVLQDTSGGSTWVNGNPIAGPTPLCVGDMITLGADATPATLEIDPAAVGDGRTGEPAMTDEAEPAPAASAPVPGFRPSSAKPASPRPAPSSGYYAKPPSAPPPVLRQAPPPPSDDPWGAAPAADDAFAGWGEPAGAASVAATSVRRKKPPKGMSPMALGFGILACIVIVVGAGAIVYKETHPDVPQPVKAAPVEAPTKHPNSIFDTGINSGPAASPKANSAATVVATVAPNKRAVAASAEPKEMEANDSSSSPTGSPDSGSIPAGSGDADKKDKSWDEIEGASFSPEIGQAILKFDDYRRQHPDSHTKDLDTYTNDAMDRLWWNRINSLCAKRKSLNNDIKLKDKDIRDEPKAAFKKTLGDEKKMKEAELALVQEHLASEMGYTSDDAPALDDKEAMAKLFADRDASKFGAWKVHTLKFIRTNHGSTPWDGE